MMSGRFPWTSALGYILATGFGIAFALCGAPSVWPALRDGTLGSPGELHSCDIYLEAVTHRSPFAAKLAAALHALPPEQPVAIVMRKDEADSSMLGMLSAYLAWPHSIRILCLEPDRRTFDPRGCAAIIYCNLPSAPSKHPAIAFSKNYSIALPPFE